MAGMTDWLSRSAWMLVKLTLSMVEWSSAVATAAEPDSEFACCPLDAARF